MGSPGHVHQSFCDLYGSSGEKNAPFAIPAREMQCEEVGGTSVDVIYDEQPTNAALF